MSMLAENKSRPSWVLNPRASDWSKDQNKLGQKMLEKMGWSAGKGLGAKEQGRVDALRIAYKADVRGLGASRKKEQEYWLQQQESFQSLLQNLNGGNDQNVEVKSLEERSKTSRSRVHYHKFTRGKDISRYSKKDLSCIVGGGVAAPKVIPGSVVSGDSPDLSEDQLEPQNPGDTGKTEESSPDPQQDSVEEMLLRSKRIAGASDPVLEEHVAPSKKKKSKNAKVDDLEVDTSNVEQDSPGMKRRKSNRKRVSDQGTAGDVETDVKGSKRKSKKTKAIAEDNTAAEQVTAVDEGSSRTKTRKSNQKEISNPEIAVSDKKRSKRKASKTDKENEISVDHIPPMEVDENVPNSSKTSRKKKGSKKSVSEEASKTDKENEISVDHIPPIEVDENVPNSSKTSRKKKGGKKSVSEEADDCSSVVPVKQGRKKKSAQVMDVVEDKDEDKKKKKRKEKLNVETDTTVEKQPPKKKSKKKNDVEENEVIQICSKEESGSGKDKKKKKKKKDENSAEEELHVSASQETVVSSNTHLENEDAETELGSINSQSSLFNELFGAKPRNSIDLSSRPESWFKNHILSNESEDEVSSDEERMTGVPKTKKS